MSKPEIIDIHPADENNQVVTVKGGKHAYRREPCDGCPWRVDQTGSFPAEAFRHSANTAEDMSEREFACHMSGSDHPTTCAGFLLRGADHNLATRMKSAQGRYDWDDIRDGGHELHDDYRAMAIANGVDPRDDALRNTR